MTAALPDLVLPELSSIAGISDPREWMFCREYVRTSNLYSAAIIAGIAINGQPVRIAAERLWLRQDIQQAVALLRKQKAEEATVLVTRESISADMQYVYEKAIERTDLANAINAKKTQAQLHGLLVSKVEVSRTVENPDELSTEELVAEIKKRRSAAVAERPWSAETKMIDVTPEKVESDG